MSLVDVTVRLPAGVAREIERLAKAAGVTTEQFLASAAAEKLDAIMDARTFLADRAKNADWGAFREVFGPGGELPQDWDKVE
jgi:hypothetical protein